MNDKCILIIFIIEELKEEINQIILNKFKTLKI